jgi:transcriptional regulator with XRE-family HTH domain
VNVATTLRDGRTRAGLTQAELAARAGTSQATISAYESGRKSPSVPTLERLLAATGLRLAVEARARPVVRPTAADLARAGRTLVDVVALAEELPASHEPTLRFSRLEPSRRAA